MRPPPQHTCWYATVDNGPEQRRRPHRMRLLSVYTVRVVNGCRVLPLSRAWHSLANGQRSATPLSRPVGGDGDISRPPRDHAISLGTRHCHGDRASIRVWCSHSGVHLCIEITSEDATDGRLPSALEGE